MPNFVGGPGDDSLVGTISADTLSGLDGNDTLEGGDGADTLDGGSGNDTASYSTATSGVNVYLIPGGTDPNTGAAAGDVFISIENLRGSAFNDLLFGNQFDNILWGGDGEDTLYGWTSGTNRLNGEGDADTLVGGPGIDIMDGGAGSDPLRFNGDTVSYQLSNAGVTVSLLNQAINTGDAAGDTYLNMEDVTGSQFNDIIYGNDGALNNLDGLSGNDQIFGGGGVDIMIGGAGADTLNGGDGDDLLDYETFRFTTSNATLLGDQTGVTASMLDTTINTADAVGDVYISLENMAGSLFNDTLHGDNNRNVILAWPGADRIFGHGGDDTLEGMPGADTIDGGAGIDTASYDSAGTLVIASWGFYTQVGMGVTASLLNPAINTNDAAGDQYVGVENLLGSGFADTLQGDNAANTLFGRNGNDLLQGEGADDTLVGGVGADTMNGGAGSDTASYAGSAQAVTVAMDGSLTAAGDAVGDVFVSIEKIDGTNFNDVIRGDASTNLLLGESGNDSLDGRAGDDVLIGGAGADTLLGGDGLDTASYQTAAAAVTVSFANVGANTGEAAGDVYSDTFEQLVGSDFNDTLTGHQNVTTTLFGGAGADTLIGGAAGDVLVGGAGADSIVGGGGVDNASYLLATAGVTAFMLAPQLGAGEAAGDQFVDVENLLGSNFDDTLGGTDGGNAILGNAGNDQLYGAGGDDVLTGGAGADRLDGQAGIDAASYDTASAGVVVSMINTAFNQGEATGDTYFGVENLIGSAFGDVLGGDDAQNAIFGGAGGDDLRGEGADDILVGGSGADTLNGGSGSDTVSYAEAATSVSLALDGSIGTFGDAVGDVFVSIEKVDGSAFNDVIWGDGAANILVGQGGADSLNGQGGDDTLIGGVGGDTMVGGAGVDTASYQTASAGVTASFQNAALNTGDAAGDAYFDVIEQLLGSDFNDSLTGHQNATTTLFGGAGADTLTGGFADDVLIGGAGADSIVGGGGVDNASYFLATSGVTAFMLAPSLGTGDAAGDVFVDVENLLGSTFNDVLGGTDGGNAILGNAGDDQLYGAGGDDVLTGGVGADRIDGQDGIDTAAYNLASGRVVVFLLGPSLNEGEAAGDTHFGVENVIGSSFDDVIGGSDVQNALFGGVGGDQLYGAGGDDVLEGGLGADRIDGQAGFDYASYSQATSGVWALLGGGSFLNQGEAVGDTYVSVEGLLGSNFADFLVGDDVENTLQGSGGNDWLFGNGGQDFLVGGDGDDILAGGAGNDLLQGGAGQDIAFYRDATTGVRVDFTNRLTNTGEAAFDDYNSVESIWASDFNDVLVGDDAGGQVYGFAGDDVLVGNGGNDVFYGGLGRDTINGGSGAEDFFFLRYDGANNEGGDTFQDFQSGVDRITVSRFWFGFGNIAGPAAALTTAHATFVTNGAAIDARPTFLWNTTSRELWFDADGTGGTSAILLATLQQGATITLNDIWTA